MLKNKKKSNTSKIDSDFENSLQNSNEDNSLTTETDKQNKTDWVNLITKGILSIFAGVASTGLIAGVFESITDITLPFDNPVIRFLALVLTIIWWKIITYWDTKN